MDTAFSVPFHTLAVSHELIQLLRQPVERTQTRDGDLAKSDINP